MGLRISAGHSCIIFFDIWENVFDEKLTLEWKSFMKISYFKISFSYFETSMISVLARMFKCLKNPKFMHHVSKLSFHVSKHYSSMFLYMFRNAPCLVFNVCYVYMLCWVLCFLMRPKAMKIFRVGFIFIGFSLGLKNPSPSPLLGSPF